MRKRLEKFRNDITSRFKKEAPSLLHSNIPETDTGTLRVTVSDMYPEMGVPASELIQIGAGLVMDSDCHELARALLSRSTDMLVSPLSLDNVEYIPQKVFIGKNDLAEYLFGYADYFQEKEIEIPSSLLNMMRLLYADEKETFLVAKDGAVIGLVALHVL